MLVTETSAPIWGYHAELERACHRSPDDEVRRPFGHPVAAQQFALARSARASPAPTSTAPSCATRGADLLSYWRQHTGHAIGLRNHEAPFLDLGDHTRIEPGMVFTIEPSLYDAGIGGFRHSDTVAVTEDGIDMLTDYPRDLESLTIPA